MTDANPRVKLHSISEQIAKPIARSATVAALLLTMSSPLYAAIVMSNSATAPATSLYDQYSFDTTGGGPNGSKDYSNNAGPPGQTFTTPSASADFYLNAVAFKGKGDAGGGAQAGNWGVRISSVSGTTLTPLLTNTSVAGAASAASTDWLILTFSGANRLTLSPNTTYGFELYSSSGWFGFNTSAAATAYPNGIAFNDAGSAQQFNSTTLVDRGIDRTFFAGLTLVPEPSTLVLILTSAGTLWAARKRRPYPPAAG